jgi:hypothetical protein
MAFDFISVFSGFVTVGGGILIIIILATIGSLIWWFYSQAKKWKQFVCIIFSKDAFGNAIREIDNAGIFLDKTTNMKRFFIKKANIGLDPDKVKYIMSTDGKTKYVYLRKYAPKNFAFYDLTKLLEKDNAQLSVTEQDVNWALQEFRKHKALDNKNFWNQYGTYIIWGFAVISTLVLFALLVQKFEILSSVASSISAAATALKEAAQQLAVAKSGSQIIP